MNSILNTPLWLKQTDCSVVVPHLPTLIILWHSLQSFQSWTPNFIALRIVVVIKLWSYYQTGIVQGFFFFFLGIVQSLCFSQIISIFVGLVLCKKCAGSGYSRRLWNWGFVDYWFPSLCYRFQWIFLSFSREEQNL